MLDNTLTLQTGGSDDIWLGDREVVCEELAGSEVVCELGREETAKDENALEVNHGAAPPTITRRVNRHIALIEEDLLKFIVVTNCAILC